MMASLYHTIPSQRISKIIGIVKDFPYRSMHHTIGPLRVSAIDIVFGIKILSVSYELIKDSTANPVNAIRYE
jgi:hypothetical protein